MNRNQNLSTNRVFVLLKWRCNFTHCPFHENTTNQSETFPTSFHVLECIEDQTGSKTGQVLIQWPKMDSRVFIQITFQFSYFGWNGTLFLPQLIEPCNNLFLRWSGRFLDGGRFVRCPGSNFCRWHDGQILPNNDGFKTRVPKPGWVLAPSFGKQWNHSLGTVYKNRIPTELWPQLFLPQILP